MNNYRPYPYMKGRDKGLTLIELIVAISLLTLIIFAGSGIYLSGWNMFRDAQQIAQAQNNVAVPMIHMEKRLQEALSFSLFSSTELRFLVYENEPGGNTITSIYFLRDNQIIYIPDTNIVDEEGEPQEIVVGNHIPADQNVNLFNVPNGPYGILVDIQITAYDNNDNTGNSYTISSTIEARYGQEPIVDSITVPV